MTIAPIPMSKNMKKIQLGVTISIALFLIFGWVIPSFDCMQREIYWNDRGYFIDSWEYHYPWECLYEQIPVEDSD